MFVHGLGGNARQWTPIRSAMASTVSSHAVDLAGHGQRRADHGPYTIARFAEDLVDELRRIPAAEYILVGHSLGGAVCVEAARAFPDRVRQVLAVDSLLNPLYPRFGKGMIRAYRHALTYAFKPVMHAVLRGSHTAATAQWVKDEAADELLNLRREVALDALLSLAEWDRDAVVSRCTATTIVAYPAADLRFGGQSAAVADMMKVRPVGAGGHYYFKMMPELIASLVDAAVSEMPGTPR
nr:alpha/beta fold hydrolase [Streptomyces antibioticus]